MVDLNSVSSVQAPSAAQPVVKNPAPDVTDANAQNATAADSKPETLPAPDDAAAAPSPSSSSVYSAVASASDSTIRGTAVNVVT